MIITMTALGSRGDVQPFAALAVALADRGHEVRLITHGEFRDLVAGRGPSVHPVTGDIRKDLEGAASRRMFAHGANPLTVAGAMREFVKRYSVEWARISLEAARGSDLLVPTGPSAYSGLTAAEVLDIPFVQAFPQPILPTSAFPSPIMPVPKIPLPGFLYKAQHLAIGQVFWEVFRPGVNLARREVVGLPPLPRFGMLKRMRREHRPVLLCYSRHVVPVPPDWPAEVDVTGYWFLDHPDWTMPADLARFLEAGPPPVYLGFGSMRPENAAATTALLLAAVRKAGCRAVLAGGWGGLAARDLPPEVFPLDAAPHDRLFPHMAAVVHHGGAGTTGAGVRAGVPAVIVPFLADQFFWGWRLEQLGVSGGTLPHAKLTADGLAAALRRTLDDPDMRARARVLGAKVGAEDGLTRAVERIEAVHAGGRDRRAA